MKEDDDMFQLLCEESSKEEGWTKTAEAKEIPEGCLVRVTTQKRNPDGTLTVTETLTLIPDVIIVPDKNNEIKLVQKYL